ncbi:hypothetical protein B6K86_09775 [Lachnospiraceae bacterium]|nr:hypothetical protein B6K86_09775 [Lachnospiraceae bacterium]
MTEEEFDKLLGESIELKILKLIKFDRKILKCYNNRQLTERREEMIKNLKKVFPITIRECEYFSVNRSSMIFK